MKIKLEEYVKKNPSKISNNLLYFKFDRIRNPFFENLITEYLNDYFKLQIIYPAEIGLYEKISWKSNRTKLNYDLEYENDSDNDFEFYEVVRKGSKSKVASEDISRSESISDFGNFNCINNIDRSYHNKSFLACSKDLFMSTKIPDKKQQDRMSIFSNFDVIEMIRENAGPLNIGKTFSYKDLPDTRNTRKINKDTMTRINSLMNSDLNMKIFIKKEYIYLVVIFVFLFIIVKMN